MNKPHSAGIWSKHAVLRLSLGVVTGLFLLIIAFFWVQKQRQFTKVRTIIPSNAIAAIQVAKLGFAKEDMASTEAGQRLLSLPYFQRGMQCLQQLDSITEAYPDLSDMLYEQDAWFSFHRLSKYELGWIGYVRAEHPKTSRTWLKSLLQDWATQQHWVVQERKYKGFQIIAIGPEGEPSQWAMTFYKNYWVGSPHALLIEESIRQVLGQLPSELSGMPDFETKIDTTIQANCYINGNEWGNFMEAFTGVKHESMGYGWHWKIAFNEHLIQMQGKNFSPYMRGQWADWVKMASPSPSQLLHAIPDQTAFVIKGGIEDGSGLEDALIGVFSEMEKGLDSDLLNLVGQEWAYLSGDILLCQMDSAPAHSYLQELESYQNGIYLLPTESQISLQKGESPLAYLTWQQGYTALATNPTSLITWRQAVQEGRTWPDEQAFKPLYDAQRWAFCWNTEQTWPLVMEKLAKPWQELLQRYQLELLQQEAGGLYIGEENDIKATLGFHQSFLAQNKLTRNDGKSANADPRFQATLPVEARTAPLLVPQLRLDGQVESNGILFQDRWNNVRLLGEQGQRLWSVGIGKPLPQPAAPIDYYRNGRWQYLFFAENSLFIVDRLGRAIKGYPKYFPYNIAHLQIIDRGAGTDHLFVLDDPQGNAYMYLQGGAPIAAWQPLRYSGTLIRPVHASPMGEQWLLAGLQVDVLNLHDLQGDAVKGFPIPFAGLILKDLEITAGHDLEHTVIHLLASKGQVMHIDGLGKMIEKLQLPSQALDDRFELLRNEAGKGWLWARIGAKNLSAEANVALFDKAGKQLFQTPINCPTDAQLQYFDFGGNRRFLALTCLSQRNTQLYLFNGQPVGAPIPSELPIDLMYDETRQALKVYRHLGKETACLLVDVRGMEEE